ncbi:unnamed protein product [Calicophoron daubneyi]|uniref:Amine oxidase domain-containing protein n=1 Tax=Calicophoron daubneyi TaxID=300641 RepID=A0AAV2TD15_CALDB
MPESVIYDVVVLGAGIAGLAAAKVLSKEGLKTVVLEARPRNGGRIHTLRSGDSNNPTVIDLGASYLHGCVNSQEVQPLFTLASRLNMPTVTAPGDVLGPHRGWECPEVATWRDGKTGELISLTEVAEMSFLLDRCLVHILMAANQKKSNENVRRNLSDVLNTSLDACVRLLFKAAQRGSPTLSSRERGIFDSMFARYIAYVNPAERLPIRLPLGPHYEADAAAGLANDAEQPTSLAKSLYLNWLEEKREFLRMHGAKPHVAHRVEHKWEDRLVLQGFDKIIEFLAQDLDIHHRCVVRYIDWTKISPSKSKFRLSQSSELPEDKHTDDLIRIEASTYDGDELPSPSHRRTLVHYLCRFCVVTVPIGVLKGLDRRSAIRFYPLLPARKQLAIDRLGIPRIGAETHNKVVLQFNEVDVFWDRNTPQLVSPGARLHILNADYFGQPGVLVAHIWGGSKIRILNRPDEAVIKELMEILSGMYPNRPPLPQPIFTYVTRWSEDPFSLGSYTAGEVDGNDADRHAYASSLPSSDYPRLLFAGEGTVDSSGGQQCTHGAFCSGVSRALDVLDQVQGGRCRLRDVRIVDYLTGRHTQSYPPHGMVRRAMKRSHPDSVVASSKQEDRVINSSTTGRRNKKRVISSIPTTVSGAIHPDNLSLPTAPTAVCTDYQASSSNNLGHTNQILGSRRSARLSTWISTQASASLYSTYISRISKKENSRFSRERSHTSSSSTSSLSSFKDDIASSPDQQSNDGRCSSDGEEYVRLPSKHHTQPIPAANVSEQAIRSSQSLFVLGDGVSDHFGSPPVFRSPLPPLDGSRFSAKISYETANPLFEASTKSDESSMIKRPKTRTSSSLISAYTSTWTANSISKDLPSFDSLCSSASATCDRISLGRVRIKSP